MNTYHMQDVRDVRPSRWPSGRAVVALALAVAALLLAHSLAARFDLADAERVEVARRAYQAGLNDGMQRVRCLGGFREDRLTGKAMQ